MLVFAFLFIPIVYVVVYSFTSARSWFVWGGFSTKPYHADAATTTSSSTP